MCRILTLMARCSIIHAAGLTLILAILLRCGVSQGPGEYMAVANRDVDGAVVGGDSNYVATASACADLCRNTSGCTLWVWCGNTQGCSGTPSSSDRDLGKYRQCWLKYDNPSASGFPYWKNSRWQPSGFISGTTAPNAQDGAGTDEAYASCKCKGSWGAWVDGNYRYFQGVCANPNNNYSPQCDVDTSTCTNQAGLQSCPSPQSCSVLVGVDLDGTTLLAGTQNYQNSAEDCCTKCAKVKNCQVWVWCSDASGCGGGLMQYRQCWIKQGDPRNPSPKPNANPGWISGVRMAYLTSA